MEKASGKLKGAFIIGPSASELIHILMLAIHTGMTAIDLGDLEFAHPTFSETIKEVARMDNNCAIHYAQAKR